MKKNLLKLLTLVLALVMVVTVFAGCKNCLLYTSDAADE